MSDSGSPTPFASSLMSSTALVPADALIVTAPSGLMAWLGATGYDPRDQQAVWEQHPRTVV